MSIPKVSVIVPIYNAERYLRRCIDSILSLTFPEFELLLINDGSVDYSGDICDEYARKDPRVRIFHKANGGASSARNMGLDNARGEWVTFVDADDWVMPDMLVCTKTLPGEGSILLGTKRVYGKPRSGNVQYKRNESFLSVNEYLRKYKMPNAAWGIIYERGYIEKLKLRFNEELVMSEDCVFTLQYFACYPGSIHCVKGAMYIYNNANPNSACNTSISHKKCISQIKSAHIMVRIPSKGKMMSKCIQSKARKRCHYFLHALAAFASSQPRICCRHAFGKDGELWDLYEEVYACIRCPGLRLWFARHAPRMYMLCHTYSHSIFSNTSL